MFVCGFVVSFSPKIYVKCLCVVFLSRYLRCYMLDVYVLFLLSRYLRVILYVKCFCAVLLSRYLSGYMLNGFDLWFRCLVTTDVIC